MLGEIRFEDCPAVAAFTPAKVAGDLQQLAAAHSRVAWKICIVIFQPELEAICFRKNLLINGFIFPLVEDEIIEITIGVKKTCLPVSSVRWSSGSRYFRPAGRILLSPGINDRQRLDHL